MSFYYTYVLQSLKDNRTYVGYTRDVERRLAEHNKGRVSSTRARTPFKLLFSEQFESAKQAKDRELWWKSSSGRRKLKRIFEMRLNEPTIEG